MKTLMEQVNFRIDGKVVVITGGAQGLGLAMGEALSSMGADIVIGDIQDEKSKEAANAIVTWLKSQT